MPTNIRVIHARDFVRATPQGVLDLNASEKLLFEIVVAGAPLATYDVLLDTRSAVGVLGTSRSVEPRTNRRHV